MMEGVGRMNELISVEDMQKLVDIAKERQATHCGIKDGFAKLGYEQECSFVEETIEIGGG